MELRNLTAFIAVAENMSFVRAAIQLHRSQPAITAQIQRLEEELGVQLLDRDQRRVQMTAAGEAFLTGARAAVAAVEEASKQAKLASAPAERLRFAFPRTVSQEIMPRVMAELHKVYPRMKLELTPSGTSTIVSELQKGAIDLGFVRLPLAAKGIQIIPVHREPLVLCLPRNHALCTAAVVSINDLRTERFILYGRRWAPGFHDLLLEHCAQAGFSPTVSAEVDEMYVAPTLVAAGEGIAIVPRMVVHLQTKHVVVKELQSWAIHSELGIASRSANRSSVVRTAVSIVQAICKQMSVN